ncbi:MAG: hypothetical protein V1736_08460, partial [Pseudomonadota bacterium]
CAILSAEAPVWQDARRAHTVSMHPTSDAAGRDGSALRMLKLFRDRPCAAGPTAFVYGVVL